MRHFNFAVFWNNFWILGHLNFAVQPKYYISRHFNFAVVLKVVIFYCLSVQYFRNFGESKKSIGNLKYFFIFFCIPLIHKSIKNRVTSFFLVIFIIWVYNWIYKCQELSLSSFKNNFYIALSVWVIRGFQVCFFVHPKNKTCFWKNICNLLSFTGGNVFL